METNRNNETEEVFLSILCTFDTVLLAEYLFSNISSLCRCLCGSQEMTYRYFELGKNADPEREDSIQFKNAFTVHPISEPNLMYRLHKRFSQIELEQTYLQIQQLQVCNT